MSSLTPAIEVLVNLLGKQHCYTHPSDCLTYGYDNSRRQQTPQAVVFPKHHQQVQSIVEICLEHKIAITPRGRGTATTAAAVPSKDSIVISFEHMDQLIRTDFANRLMVVQPGISNHEVQKIAQQGGFFWVPDPGSSHFCSVGGNISCNSAGPRAVKYGTTRNHVMALKVVTGEGKTLETGTLTSKDSVGYDFTRLFIGAEGSLGIITEATLKLTPLAQAKRTMQIIFSSIEQAANSVIAIMNQPIIPCTLEFIDNVAIDMIRDYSSVEFPADAAAMIMLELDGDEDGIDRQLGKLREIIVNSGCVSCELAKTQKEVDELWKTRKALSPALRKIAPKKINEDVVVPVSEVPQLLKFVQHLSTKYQIKIVNFGHIGNGNIHVNLLTDPDDQEKLRQAYACLEELFSEVLRLKGSLSGEHGIGLEKKPYVDRQLSPYYRKMMHLVKQQFDPDNILNPGKQHYYEQDLP